MLVFLFMYDKNTLEGTKSSSSSSESAIFSSVPNWEFPLSIPCTEVHSSLEPYRSSLGFACVLAL